MTTERQRLGKRGEELATHRLEARGYCVVARNYRTKSGEIDLIAEEGGSLVFVEVRTRTGTSFGSPEESITPKKRATMIAAAEEYMQENGAEGREWRIDLVAVQFGPQGKLRLDVLQHAVEL